jgi:signal transduction histidine kinase/CheY-like chemotaxis protein
LPREDKEMQMNYRAQNGLKHFSVVAAYALIAYAVEHLFGGHGAVSFLWIALGLALVVLLEGGCIFLPAIFLGALLGNSVTGFSLDFSFQNALRHTMAVFLGIWLLKREGRFDDSLSTVNDYLRIIFLAFLTALFVASLAEIQKQIVPPAIIVEFDVRGFYQRLMGNALSIAIVMPLLLVWRRFPREWEQPEIALEAALILGLTFLVGQVVFLNWLNDSLGQIARGYWMFLFVTWAAVRLGSHGVVLILVVTAIQALIGAQQGTGFFSNDIAKTHLANYFFYMLCLSAAGMVLATYMATRKRAEEELKDYKDHLEETVQIRTADLVLACDASKAANKAKSAFLATMSHELRTPLNAILGFSSLMRKDSQLRQEQCDNLDIINRSGAHLLTLINDVLEMSKIESGHVQLENASFDLGFMVRDVVDMMEIRARKKGLQLLLDQSSEFPRYINGDEARLRQILINLIGNAIKFTQHGGVTIRLSTKQNAISHLLMEIEDSGPGISAEDQQRLFQPFLQLGKQAGDNKGTGLGLAITRQFVQLMGGNISIESTLDKGSLFRVDLPLSAAKETEVAKPHELEKDDVVGLAPGQPIYRILIVEDQLENQLLLTQLMERIGFEVKVAEDGTQGVELFRNWHPHLIWMDRRMPIMDGMEATKIIRSLPGGKDVKIVAVTASAFMEQRDEMLEVGMDDFIRKPYRFNEIYDGLARQLGVQYTYAVMQVNEEKTIPVTLTSEMMGVLGSELRQELHDALESLNTDRIAAVIGQVTDATLQKTLTYLADNFDYPTILNALQWSPLK